MGCFARDNFARRRILPGGSDSWLGGSTSASLVKWLFFMVYYSSGICMQAAYNILLSLLVVIYYFFCYSLLHIVFPVKKKVTFFSLKE
jgi:hypothetical protein